MGLLKFAGLLKRLGHLGGERKRYPKQLTLCSGIRRLRKRMSLTKGHGRRYARKTQLEVHELLQEDELYKKGGFENARRVPLAELRPPGRPALFCSFAACLINRLILLN